jgi:hypothetical protein
MKYILSILIAIAVSMTIACDDHRLDNSPMFRDGTHCQCDSIQKSTSLGYLWAETPYKNGKANGVAKWYYESGALMWEYPYRNDTIEGIVHNYYKSGRLRGTFVVHGKSPQLIKQYYEDGTLACEWIDYLDSTDWKKDCLAKVAP